MYSPVTKPLALEARKPTTRATSSGVPTRCMGVRARRFCTISGVTLSITPSVVVNPGQTALTRMPRGPKSTAPARVKPSTPALTPA